MQTNWPDFSAPSSTVAVVGLGKIGLPLAVQYAQHGRRVIGCDSDPTVVEAINAGRSHIQEEQELALAVPQLVKQGLLSASERTDEAVRQANVVIVIVPVAIDAEHRVDYRRIDGATEAIGNGLQPGTLVIYETTLPVNTTATRLCAILERASGLRVGTQFSLAYSPERVASGTIFRDLRIYPKIVGGIDEQSTAAAVSFYRSVLDASIMTMSSTSEAEFVKLIETTYRDVNIALANEFARFADLHGLDIAEAIAAANTQPYSHIHAPGVGVGGHCIPIYPYFLLAGLAGAEAPYGELPMLMLPRLARSINDAMAEYAAQRVEAALGSLAQQTVLILGVAYRANVREVAFTSAQLLQEAFEARGAVVYVDDPLFSRRELEELGYVPLPPEGKGEITAIVLQASHTAYQAFDVQQFAQCRVVFDGRRALDRERIEAPGIQYLSIGDGKANMQRRAPFPSFHEERELSMAERKSREGK